MIYTIGHTELYEQSFEGKKLTSEPLMKLGKTDNYNGQPYEGGCCFRTVEDAQAYIKRHGYDRYSVYGILADWDKDTEYVEGREYNSLLINAQLVRISENE